MKQFLAAVDLFPKALTLPPHEVELSPIHISSFTSSYRIGDCKSVLAQKKPVLQANEAHLLFKKFGEKQLNYNWLSGKIDTKATFKGEENEFTTNFRMQKDSLIWMSISKMLVEGVRVNITQDSVMYMDKIKKTYFAGTHDYLQKLLKIDELDLDFVQNILLGEPVMLYEDERWKGEIDSSFYVLKNVPGKKLRKALGITRDEDFDIPADSLYLYTTVNRRLGKVLRKNKENDRFLKRYFLDGEFRLVKMLLTDVINNRLIEIKYSEFAQIEHIIVDITDTAENTHVDLLYTKLKTEVPTSTPFKIPESYEPVKP